MPSTTRFKRGDVILVRFPFTDLTSSKRRPALVVSPDSFNDRMQDVVLVAITSQLDDERLTIDERDCVDGALPKQSAVKLGKLFTIHSTLPEETLRASPREARRGSQRASSVLFVAIGRRTT